MDNQSVKQPANQTVKEMEPSFLEFDAKKDKIEARIGQVFKLSDHELLKIDKVLEDSRCPVNAKCKWAGRVRLKLLLVKGSNEFKSFELEFVPGRLDISLNGFSKLSRFIGVENVKPEVDSKKIEDNDYLFIFYRL